MWFVLLLILARSPLPRILNTPIIVMLQKIWGGLILRVSGFNHPLLGGGGSRVAVSTFGLRGRGLGLGFLLRRIHLLQQPKVLGSRASPPKTLNPKP